MSWFSKHLNLTLLLAWVVGSLIYYWGTKNVPFELGVAWIVILILIIAIVLGTEIWYLLEKKRKLYWLFCNLLSFIGLFIILSLENKAKPKAQKIVNDGAVV